MVSTLLLMIAAKNAEATPQATSGARPAPAAVNERRVSVRFENTPVRDVLRWMTREGINFLTTDDQLPADRRVTLNVTDRPLREVLNALGEALGGRWESRNGLYVFRRGASFGFAPRSAEELRAFGDSFQIQPGKPGELRVYGFSPDNEAMKKLREEMRKNPRSFGPDSEAMKKLREEMKNKVRILPPDGNSSFYYRFGDGDVRKLNPEEMKKFRARVETQMKELRDMPGVVRVRAADIAGLLKSLTPAQREKHKNQGYLTPEDLTPEQRRMLGSMGERGEFRMIVTRDGETITITTKPKKNEP